MQLKHIVAGLLAALPTASAFYEEFCVTELGSHPVQRVSTTTVTSTIDFDLYETLHTKITSTTTPVVSVTTTETDTTSETASIITDVFSTTITSTYTETDSTTVTASASITSTTTITTTPVLTIAAGPSFTPILIEAEVIPFERRRHRRRNQGRYNNREAEAEERSIRTIQPFGRNVDGSKQCPAQYPQSVQCFKIVENIIIESTTITKTKTATASTSTNTITDTTTITNTIIPPDVSTTITDTASTTTTTTETDTTTTTSTETDSITVAAPTSTSYAQCQSNNVVGLIGGLSVIAVYGFSSSSTLSGINSAEACCAACAMLGSACANFAYDQQCYVVNGPATCSSNTAYTSYSQITAGGGALLYFIGNGACGLTDISQYQ